MAVAICAAAGACSEKLRGGAGCPALCPRADVVVRDTEFDGAAVLAMDTAIVGYPGFGQAPSLLLASGSASPADSFDARAIVRFDSVSYLFRPKSGDTLRQVTVVDSALLRLRIDTTSLASPVPITIAAYDVDTVGFDTTTAVLASLFRPDRFLGSATVPNVSPRKDSVRILLDTALIRAHVMGDKRVRIGLRITSPGPARLNILPVASSLGPQLSFRPSTDTTVTKFTDAPRSLSPTTDTHLEALLSNYAILVATPPPPDPTALAVGGLPAARTFILFNLPSTIVDSATVVRATLTLHQQALPFYLPTDTLAIFPQAVISTNRVTDPGKVALFLASAALVGIDSSRTQPAFADSVNIEFVNAIRRWSKRGTDTVTRAIVLRVANEGGTTLGASFYSTAPGVPPALRPHVHLSYVTHVDFGLP